MWKNCRLHKPTAPTFRHGTGALSHCLALKGLSTLSGKGPWKRKEAKASGQDESQAHWGNVRRRIGTQNSELWTRILDLWTKNPELWIQISDFRTQNPELKFHISELRTQNLELWIQISELRTQNSELETANSGLRYFEFLTQHSDFRIFNSTLRFRLSNVRIQYSELWTQNSILSTQYSKFKCSYFIYISVVVTNCTTRMFEIWMKIYDLQSICLVSIGLIDTCIG